MSIYSEGALADESEQFLRSFKQNSEYKYMEAINQMMVKNSSYIDIDYLDLETTINVGALLIDEPEGVLQALSQATFNILKDIHYDYSQEVKDKVTVRISNYLLKKGIREINTDVINKLVSVPGLVVRTSEVKPLGIKIVYECIECQGLNDCKIQGMMMVKPSKCNNCNSKDLILRPEQSEYIDFQFIRIQELPDELPAGQLPHYVEVIVKGSLVNECRPGDRILLTGIVNIEQQDKTNIATLRMEGNNVEYLGGMDSRAENIEITQSDEAKIRQLANNPNAYENLIQSFAPGIYGHDAIKESILLMIVGSIARKNGSSRRGDINIFVVGDPGTGKSEMLKFAARIAPRGIYTSGKGNTAAGMTAAVVHDKNQMMVLEAGAVVLGDQGLVCIDEFDKTRDEDRAALHEVMEQQTCSVAKGGIVATLNARTSILAGANPNGGKWNINKSIADNVDPIPTPLLTRFDIIHIVQDIVDEQKDSAITNHILNDMQNKIGVAVDEDMLRKYLLFTKKIEPKLSKEAIECLGACYKKLRSLDTQGMITVTPRQLEGLVRLATARARLLLKEQVDLSDAERAIWLVGQSLGNIGINLDSGEFKLPEKKPTNKVAIFMQIVNHAKQPLSNVVFKALLTNEGFTEEEANDYIQKALGMGKIYEPDPGFYSKA